MPQKWRQTACEEMGIDLGGFLWIQYFNFIDICPGGKCMGGKCPGGKCPGGMCPGGNRPGW